MKARLYETIDRDYRSFIGIATRMDGIDVRLEKLRQPLVNLRMDVASLDDLLVIYASSLLVRASFTSCQA